MIKVLHFIWSANFGGIEKLVIDLAGNQMVSGKVQPVILIGCNKGQYLHILNERNIPYRIAGLKNGYRISPGIVSEIAEHMKEFDIIHLHTFNLAIILAAVKSGKKIMYTVHGNFNYGKKIRVSDRINNLLKRYFLNNKIDYISFNSSWSEKEAVAKYHLTNKNKSIIPNGTDVGDFPVTNIEIDKGIFNVGTVARFNKSKRIDRLIEGFSKFATDKSDVQLTLVGDGIEKKNLELQVQEAGITEKTYFTGYQKDILPYISAIDICVFPFHAEAFGLVVLEAYTLGKPVIIFSDSGGMLEIHGSEFTDDIVNSTGELAERLEYYYARRGQNFEREIKLRKQIATGHSLSMMEEQYFECYQNIL